MADASAHDGRMMKAKVQYQVDRNTRWCVHEAPGITGQVYTDAIPDARGGRPGFVTEYAADDSVIASTIYASVYEIRIEFRMYPDARDDHE